MNSFSLRLGFALIVLHCLLGSPQTFGQFYSVGQDPGSVRWSQIQTDNFQIIFPEEFGNQAKYVADILEFAYTHGGNSLGHRPRRIPVIIHNQTVVANGFVSWAPRRMEIYSNPPQNNDSHDWLESVLLHEFRHVVQVDKLNQGITRILNILLGEQATGIVLGLYVPLWFLEGDAVVMETAMSYSGRGRLPRFEQGLRAQVIQRGTWSYDKAVFGSYKDYVPNHYELGYQLVAAARSQYGGGVWDEVITNVARRPHSLTPFSDGLKRNTGMGKVDLYQDTFSFLDSAWTQQFSQHDYTSFRQVNESQALYTNYRYLSFLDLQTLIALKTGLSDIPRIVKINLDGTEEVLFSPGIYNAHAFSEAAGLVVWSEVRTDPRWEHRSWSEIFVYEIASGQRRKITRQSRFFAPSLNADGTRIVAAEVTSLNQYSLVVLDVQSGEVLHRLSHPENDFLMTPAWHPNGQSIVAVALNQQGKRIVVTDTSEAAFSTLWGPTHVEISRPVFQGDDVIFNAAYNGVDNIYRLDTGSGMVSQIISTGFGAVDAVFSPDGRTIAWSDYSSGGYNIALSEEPLSGTTPLEAVEDHSVKFHQIMASQEPSLMSGSNIPENLHQIRPYSRLANLLHLHSWGPVALNVDNMEVNPGASLFMQNKLSTSFASLGYEYDVNEEAGKFYLNYSYLGWYPVIDIRAETSERQSFYRNQQDQVLPFPWRENSLLLAMSVPLSYRRNQYIYGLVPTVRTGFLQATPVRDTPDFLQENNLWNMQYRLMGYRQVFSVSRDIRPRWGQVADINFRHTPAGGGDMGYVFSSRLVGFFPGVVRHHSLQLSAGYQKKKRGTRYPDRVYYGFPNLINYPRGISGQFHNELVTFSADYGFPLFYPDWSLPPLLYLQRVRMNLFTDYAFGEQQQEREGRIYLVEDEFNTLGVDLLGEMHLLRFISLMTLGSRFVYQPATSEVSVQLIFGVRF